MALAATGEGGGTAAPALADPPADATTMAVLSTGQTLTDSIDPTGDADWYAIDVVAGRSYVITLSGRDGGGGTLADPLLRLLDGAGTVLRSDDDSGTGLDARLSFTATATERLYVSAQAASASRTGSYSLSMVRAADDDHGAVPATAGSLSIGGTQAGALEITGDEDWYAVDLVAGARYRFTLSGRDGGGGTLSDPLLRLLEGDGVELAADDDGGTGLGSQLTFTATRTGRYYLSAQAATDVETGSYRLSAVRIDPNPVDPPGPTGGTPSDPLFASQWHLSGPWGLNLRPVWADYTGAGVTVGLLDQGVDGDLRDLDGNLLPRLSRVAATGAAGGGPVTALDSHGTAVAGVIAAERNGVDGVGVAYNARLVSFYDPLEGTLTDFAATAARTFRDAIGTVDVLNNSWGLGNFFLSTPSRAFLDNFNSTPFAAAGAALARLAAEGRGGLGTVVVQAAGNTAFYGDDTNLHNFQNSRHVITVAATDAAGKLAGFSTRGASVLVAAPGVNILTTDRSDGAGYGDGETASLSGTSLAAPAVSGVVALMLEANPNLGYRDVQQILALSARQTDTGNSSGWQWTGAGNWNGGGLHYSEGFGYGLVDARAAVRLSETWQGQRTEANLTVLAGGTALPAAIAIPDNDAAGIHSTLHLSGDLSIERVEVDLALDHPWIGDLVVTLTSPTGTVTTLVDRPGLGRLTDYGSSQDNVRFTFGVAGLLGEEAAGDWTLSISDRDGGLTGSLVGWTLRAYGATGTADDSYIITDEFAALAATDPSRTLINDRDGGVDTLNAAALTGAVDLDLGLGGGSIAGVRVGFTPGGIERAIGGDASDRLVAGTLSTTLIGARGDDTLTGGTGDDILSGGPGSDRIQGGRGTDIALFDTASNAVTLTLAGDAVTVTGADGADLLTGVEVLVFHDRALFLAPSAASLYDEAWYLARYPDVAAAITAGTYASGRDHWLVHGMAEGRSPSLLFDSAWYLAHNPDVASAVAAGSTTAYGHFQDFGMAEGRAGSTLFDPAAYLAANPDVAAARMPALAHYLTFGQREGRAAPVDWDYFG